MSEVCSVVVGWREEAVCVCVCVQVTVYPDTKTRLHHALILREVLRRLFLPGVSAMASRQQHKIGLHVRSRQIYYHAKSDWPLMLIVP